MNSVSPAFVDSLYTATIEYSSIFAKEPADRSISTQEGSYIYTVKEEDLPILKASEATFLGWYYNDTPVVVGQQIELVEDNTTLVFVAQWEERYYTTNGADLVAIADTIREMTETTEPISILDMPAMIRSITYVVPTTKLIISGTASDLTVIATVYENDTFDTKKVSLESNGEIENVVCGSNFTVIHNGIVEYYDVAKSTGIDFIAITTVTSSINSVSTTAKITAVPGMDANIYFHSTTNEVSTYGNY